MNDEPKIGEPVGNKPGSHPLADEQAKRLLRLYPEGFTVQDVMDVSPKIVDWRYVGEKRFEPIYEGDTRTAEQWRREKGIA